MSQPKQPLDDEEWDAEARFWKALEQACDLPEVYEWPEAAAALERLSTELSSTKARLEEVERERDGYRDDADMLRRHVAILKDDLAMERK